MSDFLDVYNKIDRFLSEEMTEEEVFIFKNQLEEFPTIREMVDKREHVNKAKARIFLKPENEFSVN